MTKKADPIVTEVRAAREAFAAKFGFDLMKIGRALQRQERTSGAAVSRRKKKKDAA